MSWNYRVFRTKYEKFGNVEEIFSIREVYYNKQGGIKGITSDIVIIGETEKELQKSLEKALQAFQKPILTSTHIPHYKLDRDEVAIL